MSQVSKKREYAMHATSFTALPSDLKPVLRSYSEIRKHMHLSLQARLSRDYAFPKVSSLQPQDHSYKNTRKLWASLKKTAIASALAHIKVDAKLKKLASRIRTESVPKLQAQPVSRPGSAESTKVTRPVFYVQQLPMISVKEAMKDREWLSKAKDNIQKSLFSLLMESNGVQLCLPNQCEPYKYYIRKGNNSKLVNQIMKTRPWWTRVKVKSEAQFLWSVKRELAFLDLLPCARTRTNSRLEGNKANFTCGVKFAPPDSKVARIVNLRPLGYGAIIESGSFCRLSNLHPFNPQETRIHNRLEANFHLTHKKALFHNMRQYYTALGDDYAQHMPVTFHVTAGEHDPEFLKFTKVFQAIETEMKEDPTDLSPGRNLWIVKPGENSNQGRDISLCSSIEQIKIEFKTPVDHRTGQKRTFIIQKYIDRPFLYYKRKFDIRCYALVTSVNGVIQGYFYSEGYLRTSSKEFTLKHTWDKYTHLTNDAVQKTSEDYGKFEHGNKISFAEFQKYLDAHVPELQVKFQEHIMTEVKKLVQDTIKATYFKLDPHRRSVSFEILGYDFMLDWKLRPLLIEVNTNPCLALVSPLLFRVIPGMLDGAFHLLLDALFPDRTWNRRVSDPVSENRWELIFHELVDGRVLLRTLQVLGTLHMLQEINDTVVDESEGEEVGEVGN